jgi:hypothetical protein
MGFYKKSPFVYEFTYIFLLLLMDMLYADILSIIVFLCVSEKALKYVFS